MRVLVLTKHLHELRGSELVAWEVAEWFSAAGDEVLLASLTFGGPLEHEPRDFEVLVNPTHLVLDDFDLIWSQHQLLLVPDQGLENAVRRRHLPVIVEASLSPHTREELVDPSVARAISADAWANSPETADFLRAISRGLLKRSHVFYNAAPRSFWEAGASAPIPSQLGRLLIVSNHVPAEVREAARLLTKEGLKVTVIGASDRVERVTAQIITSHDAVLTIGKTVAYAIAARRPVYVYDHFGGDGWLTATNIKANADFNFSGRPAKRRLTGAQIAAEVIAGFDAAASEVFRFADMHTHLQLDAHLAPLRRRAARTGGRLRSLKALVYFASRHFRAHLALARRQF